MSGKGVLQREASMTDETVAKNRAPSGSRNSFFKKIQFFEKFAKRAKRMSFEDDEEGL